MWPTSHENIEKISIIVDINCCDFQKYIFLFIFILFWAVVVCMSYRSWTCRSSLVHSFPHSSTHSFCFVSRVRKYFCFTNVLPGSSSSPSVENLKRKCEYKFKKKKTKQKNSTNIYYELKINKREKNWKQSTNANIRARPSAGPSIKPIELFAFIIDRVIRHVIFWNEG